jgi:predicted nucleotidyltransferase
MGGYDSMLPAEMNSYERRPISDSTRILLCDLAAGDSRPLHHIDADWREVFEGVCRNGLVGLANAHLKALDAELDPPPDFRQWVQHAYRGMAVGMLFMSRSIGKVLAQLNQSGIAYMVLKGPVLAHTVYPDPALRAFNDLDLLVRERDWPAIHRLLLELGFEPEEALPQPPPKLTPKMVLYESKYRHPQSGLFLEVHYDDLLNAGLASRDIEGFWSRAIDVEVEGVVVKALSLEDQLLHLCAHAHYHGFTRLNSFSDIAFLVRERASTIDWGRFLETVRVEEAQVPVYYALDFLGKLLDVHPPQTVIDAVRPDRFRTWWHERLLPEARVLSWQPMWWPDFSFYFTPLFKRLLPDLLVMGRRGEKLYCLFRLLSPSPEWLRHYYRVEEEQPGGVHYVLHPVKLFWHYLVELVDTVMGRRAGLVAD